MPWEHMDVRNGQGMTVGDIATRNSGMTKEVRHSGAANSRTRKPGVLSFTPHIYLMGSVRIVVS